MKCAILITYSILTLLVTQCTIMEESITPDGSISGGTVVTTVAAAKTGVASLNTTPMEIQLFKSSDKSVVVASTELDSQGNFRFSGLALDEYDIVSKDTLVGTLYRNITLTAAQPDYRIDSLIFYPLKEVLIVTGSMDVQSISFYTESLESNTHGDYLFDAIDYPDTSLDTHLQELQVIEQVNGVAVASSIVVHPWVSTVTLNGYSHVTIDTAITHEFYAHPESALPDSLAQFLFIQALRFAAIHHHNDSDYVSPYINEPLADSIFNDLELMYTSNDIVRTLFDDYHFNIHHSFASDWVAITIPNADTSELFSDPGIQHMIKNYSLQYDTTVSSDTSAESYIYFRSPIPFVLKNIVLNYEEIKTYENSYVMTENYVPISSAIERLVTPADITGDGDYGVYQYKQDLMSDGAMIKSYQFVIGWGDCQTGCMSYHTWGFLADTHKEITLQYETGPLLCGLLDGPESPCENDGGKIEFYLTKDTLQPAFEWTYNQYEMVHDSIALEEVPFITYDDILAFNFDTRELSLKAGTVPDSLVTAERTFVVTVDGVPFLHGRMWSEILSMPVADIVLSNTYLDGKYIFEYRGEDAYGQLSSPIRIEPLSGYLRSAGTE